MNIKETELREYFELMENRPELFAENELIPIEKDIEIIKKFTAETGKKIGVVYHSGYNMMITDLITPKNEKPYVYERVIPDSEGSVVTVVKCKDKFVLLKQFRHALRKYQYGFVRGYGEQGLSAKENAAKEIQEETGGKATERIYLGEIAADSGLTGGIAAVYLCKAENVSQKTGYEGIQELVLLEEHELVQWMASGRINDGFTLSAYALYCAYVQKNGLPF